ncbi:MAG: ATP-dependent helicase HrpB [Pseudomonadota bacterium]
MPEPKNHLPVDEALPELLEALQAGNKALLIAPPGAGKTTRVPFALLDGDWMQGRILVLEPRRIAARAAAGFMADEIGQKTGELVGYRVRLENRTSPQTRIEFLTEGVFNRMIVDNPELPGVGAVIFDEFHERSLDADLGLALALDVQNSIRPDLRILVMSATLQAEPLSRLLGDAPTIKSMGRSFPVEIEYKPRKPNQQIADTMAETIRSALQTRSGSILAFLPGQREIRQTARLLEGRLPEYASLHQLYGALEGHIQDEAIRPPALGKRKIVLATAIAETSLTIDGVEIVIDSGLRRAPRYEPATGLTRLETVRASKSSIEQRAGRAGRTAPGTAIRLWNEPQNASLPDHDTPEILEADLSGLVLDLGEWGINDPEQLSWLDLPPRPAWQEAVAQLRLLGAIEDTGRLTMTGRKLQGLPLPPRLANMVLKSVDFGASDTAARLAMLVTERGLGGNSVDLASRLEQLGRDKSTRAKAAVKAARQIAGSAGSSSTQSTDELSPGALLSLAFPDRIAKSRGAVGRFLLVNGRGANLDETDPLATAKWLVVADLQGSAAASRILSAARITEAEVLSLHAGDIETRRELEFDEKTNRFRAVVRRKLGALTLSQTLDEISADDNIADAICARIRRKGLDSLNWSGAAQNLRTRLSFLHTHLPEEWPDLSDEALTDALEDWLVPFLPGARGMDAVNAHTLYNGLQLLLTQSGRTVEEANQLAPVDFLTPTGSRIKLRYEGDKAVLAVRVQELFGLRQHPTVLGGKLPLTIELLSPGQRPIQVTTDLPGFWSGSWAEVRREMRGRYPKHPWPEDPANAQATRRAKPRAK